MKKALANALDSEGFNITPEQFNILVSLWAKDGQCQYELATCQGKDRASITRLIDSMEKENLLVRIPSENDRRIKLVYLTNKAKDLKPALTEVATKATTLATEGISQTELVSSKDVIKQIIQNLNKNE
ncbi:MAG: MarR family transcriptional regulator [Bacteroidales bacterium]|nr:MarR family transcriptional regulator [Bacteroidales bacterium]